MKRWNPNLFQKEGLASGYEKNYINNLIRAGRDIDRLNLPVIYSLAHLARLSETKYSDLHAIVSRVSSAGDFPYRNFTIRKRSGGRRWISVPVPELMTVQSWIATRILRNISVHAAAHAYVANRSNPLLAHATRHVGASWILHMDVKDFFSNISESQIYRVFRGLNYPDLLSFEMARLCTRVTPFRKGRRWKNKSIKDGVASYQTELVGSLPQGAPTSPALSNLVCRVLDSEIDELAGNCGATYGRYADDLCFSFASGSREELFEFKRSVDLILWKFGFTSNGKKTRFVPPGARKIVTGLVINHNRPTIPRELRDRIRMHLYYSHRFGIAKHCERKGFLSVVGFRNHLRGLIRYVSTIDPKMGDDFIADFESLPWVPFL